MKILWLGPFNAAMTETIERTGDRIIARSTDPLTTETVHSLAPDFAVSFNYRHKVPARVLALLPDKCLNLHLSFLPWNRGAHPILWSVLDDTPMGVSLHRMDEDLDTGPLMARHPASELGCVTFRDLHRAHMELAEWLFSAYWDRLRSGSCRVWLPEQAHPAHRQADYDLVKYLLPLGWDTPVENLRGITKADFVLSVADRNAVMAQIAQEEHRR